MKKLLYCICMALSGCTYSVVMNDTHGSAEDLVDENQAASPNVSPDITIPLKALP